MFEHDFNKYPELTNAQIADMGFSSPHIQITEDFTATVIKVHDGDTITLKADFRDFAFPLRFLNIDAPELSEGGEESRDWLKNKILHKTVQVVINASQRVGKYGRLLGRVIFNGLDVGEEEMHLGYAKPFGQRTEGELEPVGKMFALNQWL